MVFKLVPLAFSTLFTVTLLCIELHRYIHKNLCLFIILFLVWVSLHYKLDALLPEYICFILFKFSR